MLIIMKQSKTLSLGEIAEFLGGELRGDPAGSIHAINTLQDAGPGEISFLANPAYAKYLSQTKASAVLVRPAEAEMCASDAIILDNPYLGYAKLSRLFEREPSQASGIHASAVVSPQAKVAESAVIGPGVVIAPGAVVGENARLLANVYVGEDSVIGDDCCLHPNVTLYAGVTLGRRVIVHSGAVIGADGFGFANDAGRWERIAQLGGVVIGDDVVIGACTTIDRGALDNTVIEEGVILDNQIQIAHNVRIGAHTAIAACTGISGSTRIGRYCVIAGAVGIAGHLEIVDKVQITGMTMVTNSIREPGLYSSGVPVEPNAKWRKNAARFRQLDELARRIRRLEKGSSSSN